MILIPKFLEQTISNKENVKIFIFFFFLQPSY